MLERRYGHVHASDFSVEPGEYRAVELAAAVTPMGRQAREYVGVIQHGSALHIHTAISAKPGGNTDCAGNEPAARFKNDLRRRTECAFSRDR
jgi:hypothetical protein